MLAKNENGDILRINAELKWIVYVLHVFDTGLGKTTLEEINFMHRPAISNQDYFLVHSLGKANPGEINSQGSP